MWFRTLFLTSLYFFGCTAALCQRPVYQLRIYKLHAGNEQHFHERFRQQCMPIMRRYGFDIVFTSESEPLPLSLYEIVPPTDICHGPVSYITPTE